MKRRITLSIALALSIIPASLIGSHFTTEAQQGRRFRADTGLITLRPNQVLRVTVAFGDADGNGAVGGNDYALVRSRRLGYTATVGPDISSYTVASEITSAQIRVNAGEAASFDIAGGTSSTNAGVRGLILGNVVTGSVRDIRITSIVFDTSTQRVVTFVNTTFDDESGQ